MAQMHATPPVASRVIIHLHGKVDLVRDTEKQQSRSAQCCGCPPTGGCTEHSSDRAGWAGAHQGMSEAEGRLLAAHAAVMPTVVPAAPSCTSRGLFCEEVWSEPAEICRAQRPAAARATRIPQLSSPLPTAIKTASAQATPSPVGLAMAGCCACSQASQVRR